jgi:hypothetical protein
VSHDKRTQGGLSPKTLLIAGTASAVAAVVIPMLWRPGTVYAAAFTPVVVALVSELLRKPVETVQAVRVRRTDRGTALLDLEPAEPDETFDPLAPPSVEDLADLPTAASGPRAVHQRRGLTARQWKIGLVTGLVAFAAAAGVVTASELLVGDSVSSGGGRTTLFGGNSHDKTKQEQRKAEPTATETASPTPTATESASPTPTPTPTPTATPTTTPPPGATPAPGAAPPASPTPAP